MSDENISIEITDKVSASVASKILRIADNARTANDAVTRLQTALGAINSNALNQLTLNSNNATRAIQQNAFSLQRLATEQQRTAEAAQRLTTEQQRTAAAAAAAAAAQARASTAQTQGQTAAQRLAQAQTQANTAQTAGMTAAQRLATEQARTATQSANAANAADRAALAALRLQRAQNQQADASRSAASSLLGYVRAATAVIATAVAANGVIGLADAYTTLQNKLQNVTDSAGQVNVLTERLFELANRTRSAVDETSTAFVRFDRALKIMGKGQEESLRLTETVNKALVISGATTTEQASALLQLSQAFNAGKLQGDEFRAVAENMPIVLDAVAKALKKPVSEVKQLATQGKITAAVLFDAFKLMESQVDATFAKTTPTVGQAFTILKNNAEQFIGKINASTGFTNGLSQEIIALSKNLNIVALAAVVAGAALLVYFGPALLIGITSATRAMWAFTASIAANPVGLLVIALTAAVAMIIVFKDEIMASGSEVAGVYTELQNLIDLLSSYFGPILSEIGDFFGNLIGLEKDFSLKTYLLREAITALIEVFQSVAIISSDVVFVFKMVGQEIGAIAAQLVALAHLDFNGFSAISESVRADAARARKELDAFQAKVLSFGKNAPIDDELRRMNGRAGQLKAPTAALRGPGKAQPPATDLKAAAAAAARALALSKVNLELDNELQRTFLLKPEREAQARFDQIEEQFLSKKIKLTQSEAASIKAKIKAVQEAKEVQQAFDAIYEAATGPQRDYNANLTAADKLFKMGAISQDQYQQAVGRATETYKNAVDPLRQFNKDLDDQFKLLAMLKPAREIEQQLIQANNELLSKRGTGLSETERAGLTERLTLLQKQKDIQTELDSIYEGTTGRTTALAAQQAALNIAFGNGMMNADQYSVRLNKIAAETANLKLQMGDATFTDAMNASLFSMVSNFQGILPGLSQAFGDFFTSFTDGFANSVGRAIVYSENLGDAMRKIADEAIAGLITALVKLGVQWVVNSLLGQTLASTAMASQTAMSVAAGGATAAAWAPAAAMVSLASFGANSAAAMAGITATNALTQGLALAGMAGFEKGGFTGNIATDQVAGVVHGKEFVMNAAATERIGVNNLQALQSGAAAVQGVPTQSAGNGGASNGGNGNNSTNINVPVKVINVIDPSEALAAMQTEAGQKLILNVIERNPGAIRRAAR
jgi:tape measure domain-containing protein